MNEAGLREALRRAPVPEPEAAAERGLRVALAAAAENAAELPSRGRPRARMVRLAVAIAAIAVLVSPAGAAVRHWVSDAVGRGSSPPLPALTSLPGGGRLLVDSAEGPWVVSADGSKRLLGPYREATWSPHGLYVAAASGHQLTALAPDGTVRWSRSSPAGVSDPAWSPDGYRIAYRSGGRLRIVVGDGTGERPLAPGAASLAPVWEPGAPRVLAYLDAGGVVRAIAAGSGREVFAVRPAEPPRRLLWSADGSRLLVVSRGGVEALDSAGHAAWRAPAPAGWRVADAAPSAGGEDAAVALESRSGDRGAVRMLGPRGAGRTLLERPGRFSQVAYSPDGRRLLVAWPGADQWLFLRPGRSRATVAVGGIAAQFDPGAASPTSFPRIAGWCCAEGGG